MLKITSQAGLEGMMNLRRFATAVHLEAIEAKIDRRNLLTTNTLAQEISLSIGDSLL
ncbi:MAG: hypothetical protein M3N35_01240 [Candidatus Binatota bacterium]|nr:hypothetical protein [Candidatus Binatota bacterium]